MSLSTVTSKFQATIPKDIRNYLGVHAGDKLVFAVERDRVVVRRLEGIDQHYLQSVSSQMTEWLSPEDEAAFRDL